MENFWSAKKEAKWSMMALIVILLVFFLIAGRGLFVVREGDENVYSYMGKLVAGGELPYRDFFFAHPPVQLLVIAPVFLLFGYHALILKIVSLLCMAASGILVYLIARKAHTEWSGVIASALFLLSYSVLFNATIGWGIEIAVLFLLLGYYFIERMPLLGGVFFGLAAMTRMITLVAIAIIFIWMALKERKKPRSAAIGFCISFFFPTVILLAAFGRKFLMDVYLFHFLKPSYAANNLPEYWNVAVLNWPLFAAAFLFLVLFAFGKTRLRVPCVIVVGYLGILLLAKTLFGYYFLPAFAFMAVIGGIAIVELIGMMWERKAVTLAFCLGLSLTLVWNLAADAAFLSQQGFSGFSRAGEIAQFINDNFEQGPQFLGDESITPLLALITGKKIAFNAVDTNDQTFSSGAQSLTGLLEKVRQDKGNIIFLGRTTQGITTFQETRDFLNEQCAFEAQFKDDEVGAVLIYRC